MTTPNSDLTWLLDDLAARVPGIGAVVMLRRDGVVVAASGGLARAETERLAAIAASFRSLANDATGYFEDGRVVRVLLDLAGKRLLITPAGELGALAAVTSDRAEMGVVGHETTVLSRRLCEYLLGPRPALLP
jgi:uncharacterized protein